MTFEEKFPSLKDEWFMEYGGTCECCANVDIQKHCIDKQRVREAIDKVRQMVLRDIKKNGGNMRQIRICDLIEKELGLCDE